MSNRTEDVANKGKIVDLVVKFMDFDMNIHEPLLVVHGISIHLDLELEQVCMFLQYQ